LAGPIPKEYQRQHINSQQSLVSLLPMNTHERPVLIPRIRLHIFFALILWLIFSGPLLVSGAAPEVNQDPTYESASDSDQGIFSRSNRKKLVRIVIAVGVIVAGCVVVSQLFKKPVKANKNAGNSPPPTSHPPALPSVPPPLPAQNHKQDS
jgi:hypothetical protein